MGKKVVSDLKQRPFQEKVAEINGELSDYGLCGGAYVKPRVKIMAYYMLFMKVIFANVACLFQIG